MKTAHHGSINFGVEMWHLENIETHQRVYWKKKCVAANCCDYHGLWLGDRGGVTCRTTALLPVKLAVTLLQLSHRAACSNTQHCIILLTYCCTADSTVLVDMLAIRSSSLLLLTVILSLCLCQYQFLSRIRLLCAQDVEQWARTERFGIPSPLSVTSVYWSWGQTDCYGCHNRVPSGWINWKSLIIVRVHLFNCSSRTAACGWLSRQQK
jgi:hypothetical protein